MAVNFKKTGNVDVNALNQQGFYEGASGDADAFWDKYRTEPTTAETVGRTAKDLGLGVIKGAGDSVMGVGRLGRMVQAGVDPFNTTEDYDAQNSSPFSGEKYEQIDKSLEADNKTQMAGKVAEFAAEAFFPAGQIARGLGLSEKVGKPIASGVDAVTSKAGQVVSGVTDNKIVSGVTQTGKEMLERVPRFVGKVGDNLEESAIRAQRIATSDPVTAKAIKSGLDDKFINTVSQADEETAKRYREIVEIAENPSKTLNPSKRPEIVAGDVASEQYKKIDQARKKVGEQIGATVDELSKKGSVEVLSSQRQMRQVLLDNGIKPDISGTLQFTGKYTPAERSKIQELYKLATEGGESLTPRQVYDMDRMFSKLQREARFDGVGDLMVSTPNGDMSMFRVFRDIYANKLDEIAPDIRDLNKQYRNYITLQDDIENSIVKSGNFEGLKGVDNAEFAQTNLRRLFSDSNSAAAYREIYDQMDEMARLNGYTGARADDLAAFAYELRKLYPEVTPRTSFEGGIKSVFGNIIDKVTTMGAPDITDQQKALKELLEARLPVNK